jgi:hypothetical protein
LAPALANGSDRDVGLPTRLTFALYCNVNVRFVADGRLGVGGPQQRAAAMASSSWDAVAVHLSVYL